MEIRKAPHIGYCKGVKRALAMAEQAVAEKGFVETWGPLIHNPGELARLSQTIRAVDDLGQVRGGRVLLRAHGVSPKVLAAAEALGVEIIDGTCPDVARVQKLAARFTAEGYQVIILGDPRHPEVEGVKGWSGDTALVVRNAQEASALPALEKAALIAQTTERESNFLATAWALESRVEDLVAVNTICGHTRRLQAATANLARQADAMLVLGGRNSSNTLKLAQISEEAGLPVFLVESLVDLDIDIVRSGRVIGLTAGASTPEHFIEEVVERMSELEKLENEGAEIMAEQASEITQESSAGAEAAAADVAEAAAGAEAEAQEGQAEQEATVAAAGQDQAAAEEPDSPDAPESAAPQDSEEPAASSANEADAFTQEYGDMKEIRRGARVKGVVVQVKDDELLVDIGGKSEGVLSSSELSADDARNIHERFQIGDEIDVLILRKENQEGYPVLSKRRVDQDLAWDRLAQLKQEKAIVTGVVSDVVKGGVLVDVGVRGFVPASLVSLGYVEDLSTYVGKELQMKIIECDKHSNKLVLSAKAVLRRASQALKEQTWAEVEEGQTRHGVVRRLTSFGAFVDIGGVDGLLHVSEIAWYRVNHPADLLKEGDEVDVYILGVDRENEKISLGMKQLIPNPWSQAKEKYPEGSVIPAKVMRTTDFGAFLEVEPGVEGLVHISQMAHHRVEKTEDVVKPGDDVMVKVISVDAEAKRMSLSIKATLPEDGELPLEEAPACGVQQVTEADYNHVPLDLQDDRAYEMAYEEAAEEAPAAPAEEGPAEA